MKYGRYLVSMTQRDMDKYEIWKVPCFDESQAADCTHKSTGD